MIIKKKIENKNENLKSLNIEKLLFIKELKRFREE